VVLKCNLFENKAIVSWKLWYHHQYNNDRPETRICSKNHGYV